ncbi:MAG: transposase [bacterium]|nr:transposase [bacterium]
MPAKNRIRQYLADSSYHCYNRGVEKRQIFLDKQDYSVFLSYLKDYLSPIDNGDIQSRISNRVKNYSDDISLLAYCLMPNHYHLMLHQQTKNGIIHFMQSLSTRYTMYFNSKYKRVGSLFQGTYKAVHVLTDEQLIYLSYYIHHQATIGLQGQTLQVQNPSSLPIYLEHITQNWVKPNRVLAWFDTSRSSINNYRKFIDQIDSGRDVVNPIEKLLLE